MAGGSLRDYIHPVGFPFLMIGYRGVRRECLEVQEEILPAISGGPGHYRVLEIVVIWYEKEMNWTDDILGKEIIMRLASIL